MIREAETFDEIALISEKSSDPFMSMIFSDYILMKNFDGVRLFFQESGEQITAVMLCNRGAFTVFTQSDCDSGEIENFLELYGFSAVICPGAVTLELSDTLKAHGNIMKYSGTENVLTDSATQLSSENVKSLYKILSENFTETGDYEEWLPDISHKMRHGTAKAFAVLEENEPVSCALSLHETKSTAFIGGVCTKKEYRNRGYAKECILSLVKSLTDGGKDNIFLFCGEGDITKYYEKSGFTVCGGWNEYLRKA